MASWMIHLRVADRLLDTLHVPEAEAFILGTMAPDSGVVTENGYEPPKEVTHFRMDDGSGRVRVCPEAYAARYLFGALSQEARAFHLGYVTHLICDLCWNRVILPEAKSSFPALLETDPAAFWRMVKQDWYDMDFLFLRAHPDFRPWQIYCRLTDMENHYVDFYGKNAFADRRQWIVDFYREGADGVTAREMYLPQETLDAFVEDAVKETLRALRQMMIVS
ncbi:MAG: hypothetical protein IKK21_09890 [Clostridia bacterium]|nr:hypothetical protein [Clostridia bacterium]